MASPVQAQSGSRWEIEAHGGFAGGSGGEGGDATAPPGGQPLTTFSGRTSSRVSSWLYGDGTRLLNDSFAGVFLFPAGHITTLDPALETAATTAGGGASFGFRVGYAVTPRLSAEFNVDSTPASGWNDDFLDAVEESRASFVSAWNGLFGVAGGLLFPNGSATATAEITRHSGRHLLTTGAIAYSFAAQGAITPFVTAGAGVRTGGGEGPAATITGNYQFNNSSPQLRFQINETDTVTLRSVSGNAFTLLLGGGLKIAGSARWGVRTDVRAHIIRNTTDLVLSAAPAIQTSTPAGGITFGSNPSVQFSNSPTIPFVSSLSGPAVNEFTVFEGSGYSVQVNAAAGVYFRF